MNTVPGHLLEGAGGNVLIPGDPQILSELLEDLGRYLQAEVFSLPGHEKVHCKLQAHRAAASAYYDAMYGTPDTSEEARVTRARLRQRLTMRACTGTMFLPGNGEYREALLAYVAELEALDFAVIARR